MGSLVMAGYITSNGRRVEFAGLNLVNNCPLEYHENAVRQRNQFVQVFAHEQHGCLAVARAASSGSMSRSTMRKPSSWNRANCSGVSGFAANVMARAPEGLLPDAHATGLRFRQRIG